MIRSMTGFGRGIAKTGAVQITVDIRSVNHRYLDTVVRMPKDLVDAEGEVRAAVKDVLSRGRVEVFVGRQADAAASTEVVVHDSVAATYVNEGKRLAKKLGLSYDLGVENVLSQRGVVEFRESAADAEKEVAALLSALKKALRALTKMQTAEGRNLKNDLAARIDAIEAHRKTIRSHLPGLQKAMLARTRARVQEIAGGVSLDEARLAQEVAHLATRTDITEEIVRLKSHLGQMKRLLTSKEPIGRKLEFLLQEAHREISTIGSKINSGDVSAVVVEVKSELEKIREQAQNIE